MNPEKEYESWVDEIGQEYRAGDLVAYASVVGSAAQLVYAIVERINKVTSKGEPIVSVTYKWGRELVRPSCSVTVRPVFCSRGYYRSGREKAVTLRYPSNIVKVHASVLRALEEE